MSAELDLNAIRAALAAATRPQRTLVGSESWRRAHDHLIANAPVWLAQLISEVERVTVLCETVINDADSRIIKLRAERDAALARNDQWANDWAGVQAQLDAALTENKRLRARLREEMGVES